MKLPTSRLAAFLRNPDPAVRIILIYGPDAGLVRERGAQLSKLIVPNPNDPFLSVTLPPGTLGSDPARLRDEMASVAFGGGRKLIRVTGPDEGAAKAVSALLEDMPAGGNILLIEASDLDKKSKLRSACEADTPLACAIPCYVEDVVARQRTIAEILEAENIRAARDVLATLAEVLPPDRLAMRSELEKFALYVGKGNAASIGDVHAVLQDAGAAELDDLVFAVGAGEAGHTAQLIDRLFGEQTSPVALLRAAQRHFIRIQWARAEMDKGISAPEAVKRLQPPVFWKYESAMASQLRRWSRSRTEQALRRLYDAEASVKQTGTPDTALCAQILLGLAA